MSNDELMPIFETSQERTDWIRDHATYFTLTWYQNRRHRTFFYSSIEKARHNGRIATTFLKRPVMIYAVWCPEEGFGYDTWIETVHPRKRL